jgi:hypothetical protein
LGEAPAGPYTASCQYATVVENQLTATCTVSGGVVTASLADFKNCLPGTIANLGGTLVCDREGTPEGQYAKSCMGKWVSNGALKGLCKTRSGAYKSASLGSYERCVPGSIANLNGALVCDWTEVPAGSYTKSCFFKKTSDAMLIASCLDKRGDLLPTSLADYASCQGGIRNDNGELRCGTE